MTSSHGGGADDNDAQAGHVVAFRPTDGLDFVSHVDMCPTLKVGSGIGIPSPPAIMRDDLSVRRLTPLECERLQGFPDGWTDGPDSARYRQLGNAVAVPCAEWIGRRIAAYVAAQADEEDAA